MNAILVPLSVSVTAVFLVVTAFWSIGMAVSYSKLWQEGFNWRDVFRQPRDRLLFDVAAESIDDARAFDETKREKVRARARARASAGLFNDRAPAMSAGQRNMPRSPLPGESNPPPALPADNSPYGSALASVRMDRDEIYRQMRQCRKTRKCRFRMCRSLRTLSIERRCRLRATCRSST